MKKFFSVMFSLLFLLNPILVGAVTAEDKEIDINDYKTMNFKEILKEEQIEEKYPEYKERDDQITIYLFRGSGCHYCQNFLNFLNSITEEYGKYFKVVGFEVWSDADNSDLMTKVSAFLEDPAQGVPYIIIGDQTFPGYASDYDDGIKAAIKSLYESEDRYDVFEAYNQAIKDAKKAAKGNTSTIVFWNILITACGALSVIFYTKKQNEAILEKIEKLNKKEETKHESNTKKKK